MMRPLPLACLLSLAVTAAVAQDPVRTDPKHYKVMYENDQVRVLLVSYGPHEKSPMHDHPAALVVSTTDRYEKTTSPDGRTQEIRARAGELAAGGGKHSAENLGDKPMEVLLVELKNQVARVALVASLDTIMAQKGEANEVEASAYLRTLNGAEITYSGAYNSGYTDTLDRLGPPRGGGKPDARGADYVIALLAGRLEGGTSTSFVAAGYRFTYTPGPGPFGKIAGYAISARPLMYGCTGKRSIFTDPSGVLHATLDDRAATAQDPTF